MPRQFQEMAAKSLHIPADVALGEPVITITGAGGCIWKIMSGLSVWIRMRSGCRPGPAGSRFWVPALELNIIPGRDDDHRSDHFREYGSQGREKGVIREAGSGRGDI